MRLFIGIEVAEELKEAIVDLQRKFSDFDIKFVEKENLHFCLKFIGEDDPERWKGKLDKLKGTGKFGIHIEGIGVFPNENYIRVIWIGANGSKKMAELAKKLGNIEFIAHLTIGRVRSVRDKEELKKAVINYKNIVIGAMEVDKVILFSSELTPNGPRYKEEYVVDL